MTINDKRMPNPKYLSTILPTQTCLLIVKTLQGAFVHTSDIELEIQSAWVLYIAGKLFNIIVQIKHGQLYIRLGSGANNPNSSIIVR